MSSMPKKTDVILIGAGVMSATLGVLLKELAPEINIKVFEKLASAGEESSNEWNNAGTGHAALCELNYTTENADGSIDISKAVKVNEQFQLSRQFWSHLVKEGVLPNPKEFIMPIPHMSMVEGTENVEFLKKRLEALSANPLFAGMEYSEDPAKLAEWIPLIMNGRTSPEPIAATKIDSGTDVNFGALTRILFEYLAQHDVAINYQHGVEDLKRVDGGWEVKVKNERDHRIEHHTAQFVFIGGGGGSLPLLQKQASRNRSKSVVSRSVVYSSFVKILRSSNSTMRKSTEKRKSEHRRCQYHTWIHDTSMGRNHFSSDRLLVSHRSSLRQDRILI